MGFRYKDNIFYKKPNSVDLNKIPTGLDIFNPGQIDYLYSLCFVVPMIS